MMNLMINGIDAMKDVDGARDDTGVGLPVQQADQISLKGSAWACPSALSRMAGACGLTTTLRAAQIFISLCPPKPS